MPRPGRGISLRVEVDHQHLEVRFGESRSQIDRGRRLADAALLVRDRHDTGRARRPEMRLFSDGGGRGGRSGSGLLGHRRSPPRGSASTGGSSNRWSARCFRPRPRPIGRHRIGGRYVVDPARPLRGHRSSALPDTRRGARLGRANTLHSPAWGQASPPGFGETPRRSLCSSPVPRAVRPTVSRGTSQPFGSTDPRLAECSTWNVHSLRGRGRPSVLRTAVAWTGYRPAADIAHRSRRSRSTWTVLPGLEPSTQGETQP